MTSLANAAILFTLLSFSHACGEQENEEVVYDFGCRLPQPVCSDNIGFWCENDVSKFVDCKKGKTQCNYDKFRAWCSD